MDYQNRERNIKLINDLFIFNIKYIKLISPFLGDTILENWNSIINVDSESKYSRLMIKIKNNLNKIKENKNNKINYKELKEGNLKVIDCYEIDKKYRVFISKKIKSLDNIIDIILFLLFEYDKYREKIVIKKNNIVNHVVKYVKDQQGNIYANMILSGGRLTFDSGSFNNEKWLFKNAIKNNTKLELVIPEDLDGSLSPFEKKRRIYLFTMNDIYRDINCIMKEPFDIYYPIDKFFKYANTFVLSLYKETFEYNRRNANLNELWMKTINSYGTSVGLDYYEKMYWFLMNNVSSLDIVILVSFKEMSNVEKRKKEYVLFKDILGIVPSLVDIYSAYNSIVIKNISSNYKYYLVDFEERIAASIKYMDVSEMISFYRTFKDVLKINNASNDLYVLLQKSVSKGIKSRINEGLKVIVKEYLKEEVLF